MSRTMIAFVLALATSAPARAEERSVARIDHTFPPPRDARRPDLTITGADARLLVYSADGRAVATSGGNTIKLWQTRTGEDGTGELLRTFEGQKSKVVALGWRGEGTLVSVSDKQVVQSWEASTGKANPPVTLKAALRNVVIRPGPEPLLAGQVGGQVGLWNEETGAAGRTFEPKDARVRALAFTADGKRLVAGNDRGTVRVWDVETGALVRTFEAGAAPRALAASGTHVAVALASGKVKVWALEEGVVQTLEGPRGGVTAVAFGAKGDQLALSGGGGAIEVWDVATGTRLCSQEGHAGAVLAVAFNPNGQKMASAGADRSVRSWTVPLPPLAPADLEKLAAAVPAEATAKPKKPRKVLVFWRADAILHKGGVPAANKAIELMGKKTGAFEAHFSRDFEALDPKVLAGYDAIVLNSTAHLVIPERAKQALLAYANGGGGIIGIHAAIDTFKGWPEGAAIVGATFAGHPWSPSGSWSVKLEEPAHPLLRAFAGKDFKMHDEFYELADPYTRSDRRVLMSMDTRDPVTANVKPLHRADKDFAVSWIKRQGEGRVFYCMFGHLADPFLLPAVQRYYLDGIQFALGDLEVDASPRPTAAAAK
jgi:type 1 glutamine amidotransferase